MKSIPKSLGGASLFSDGGDVVLDDDRCGQHLRPAGALRADRACVPVQVSVGGVPSARPAPTSSVGWSRSRRPGPSQCSPGLMSRQRRDSLLVRQATHGADRQRDALGQRLTLFPADCGPEPVTSGQGPWQLGGGGLEGAVSSWWVRVNGPWADLASSAVVRHLAETRGPGRAAHK